MGKEIKQDKWLFSKRIDLIFLFIPVWVVWIVCFLLPSDSLHQGISLWIWLLIVVGIDVGHVWSTIFRTYTDKEEFKNHKTLLIIAPCLTFSVFFLIAGFSQAFFWTVLAYIALYHFIKQQYGFMRIYKAKAKDFKAKWIRDEWVIYLGMVYPVIYWHLSPKREFAWFVSGDFFTFIPAISGIQITEVFAVSHVLYWLIIAGWLIQEIITRSEFLIGKILWILTTAGNWYLGIVYFNSDLVFTLTNVVAHGIPYLALIFYYVEKKRGVNGFIWKSGKKNPHLKEILLDE